MTTTYTVPLVIGWIGIAVAAACAIGAIRAARRAVKAAKRAAEEREKADAALAEIRRRYPDYDVEAELQRLKDWMDGGS